MIKIYQLIYKSSE